MVLFSFQEGKSVTFPFRGPSLEWYEACLLYTSDAADDLLCVDLGGRRIIKKKTIHPHIHFH